MRRRLAFGAAVVTLLVGTSMASAQYPPPPQPYPQPQPAPAPYPAPQPAPGPYPQQYPQQPYPPQPYPPQPGPQQPYPPQPYPQPYPPQPGQYPAPAPAPAQPAPSTYRSPGEMAYLYGVSIAYGVGTGIWIDALAKVNDPGIGIIAPLIFGAAMPIGAYFWDANDEFERGVPSTIATGMLLGGVEGIAVSGLQWQMTGGTNGNSSQWGFGTWSTLTWIGATGGGVGGFAFGEWLHPDPRHLAFIASGAAWGSLAGAQFGAGVAGSSNTMGNGAALWGFALYNGGIAATGILSTVYTPSWQSLKYMWIGDALGTLAGTPVFLFYLGGGEAQHGLIATSLTGLAGLGLAAALTANLTDAPGSGSWKPPFQIGVAPSPGGGAQLAAYGDW
jgi:hypothetical protein